MSTIYTTSKGRTHGHRRRAAVWLAAVVSLGAAAAPLGAQASDARSVGLAALTTTPDSAAVLFLRSVRAIRWSAAAQFLDDEALGRFFETTRMLAAADTSGEVGHYLVATDSISLRALARPEVFAQAIGATIDGMPGLMHSLYDRDDEVLGHVSEVEGRAHVVYRTTARISGAVPEVKVMQLRHGPDGWRVSWSDELEVLDAALRGVGRR